MFCTNCGQEIVEGAKFCPKCGQEIGVRVTNSNSQTTNNTGTINNEPMMNARATSIVAYMTWIGFLIAICAGDRNGAKFYLNQALVYNIFSLLCFIPFVGWLWAIFMLVCFIFGVIWAAEQDARELPLIGKIRILN